MDIKNIRNFSIIAHIDHGKSTLADRLIEFCQSISADKIQEQILDSMDLEKERGITIKSQTASLCYQALNGTRYQLNLIDTPGHVDFSYEVSRALASCEGAILLIDATSSIQAQTMANYALAKQQGLDIIVAINKVDSPNADIDKCKQEIRDILKLDPQEVMLCSARLGTGIECILESIVQKIRPPEGNSHHPLCARIIDSWFDPFVGVVSLIRIYQGIISKHHRVKVFSTGKIYKISGIGLFTPLKVYQDHLSAGQVGFIYGAVKNIQGAPVGDSIMSAADDSTSPLEGFMAPIPKIYAGIFPIENKDFEKLKLALSKLILNDASLVTHPTHSHTLGSGFRCGFLGLLHLEITTERLRREYEVDLIVLPPSVTYRVFVKGKQNYQEIDNPTDMPPLTKIEYISEPISQVTVLTPLAYLGAVLQLCQEKGGIQKSISYGESGAIIIYDMPLLEVIQDFSDSIKSISKGYGSFEYRDKDYMQADVVVLKILINDEEVEALATFCKREHASKAGKKIVHALVDIIPRAQFAIKIQAAAGSVKNVVARGDIKAFRKNVTGKCYGGDRTRKMKLLEQQKRGKRKMKSLGRVDLPAQAFLNIFKK